MAPVLVAKGRSALAAADGLQDDAVGHVTRGVDACVLAAEARGDVLRVAAGSAFAADCDIELHRLAPLEENALPPAPPPTPIDCATMPWT